MTQGKLSFSNSERKVALAFFTEVVNLFPGIPEAHEYRAQCLFILVRIWICYEEKVVSESLVWLNWFSDRWFCCRFRTLCKFWFSLEMRVMTSRSYCPQMWPRSYKRRTYLQIWATLIETARKTVVGKRIWKFTLTHSSFLFHRVIMLKLSVTAIQVLFWDSTILKLLSFPVSLV